MVNDDLFLNQDQTDLFGEPSRIEIKNNDLLARTANHIREIVRNNPSIVTGQSIGEIERKIVVSVWLENGLRTLIPDIDQRGNVTDWLRSSSCTDVEVIRRACRFLRQNDLIRFPQEAIIDGERQRERISRSVKR